MNGGKRETEVRRKDVKLMPGYDGTGPQGQGPMTGRGMGFCVLTTSQENPGQVKGFAGLQGVPVGQISDAGSYGYGAPYYAGWGNPWFRRGFGFGRGFGRGWGRGRGRGRWVW